MTRKKSNVKALALAVTCAILAGGYSGLNPVYAADSVYHDVVKYDSANQTLDYEFDAGAGTGTAAIRKIKFGNVVLDGSNVASPIITVGSYFSIDGSDGSISAASNKFMVSGAGAITASSLKLTGTYKFDDVGKAINDNITNIATNKTNIATNKADITSLDGKIDTVNTNIRSVMANEVSTINTKIDTKLDTSTFGAYTASNDAAVNELKNKTQNIKVAKDNMVTSNDATYIDGITHAGGVRLADNGVRAEELVLEEGSSQATLTREGLAALNSMVYDANDKINSDTNGKPIIQAGNGSVVGGVTFDNKNITNVDSVMVNKDANNQVQINSEGIVVGLHSTVIGSDGVYAGGHDFAGAKAAIDGKDGKIKGANGEFGVDDKGNVTTTGDIKGKNVTVDGKLSANGDAVVGGDLSVAGKANFAKEATFAGGITTDAINEATPDKGVTIDGVLLKDKGISAAGGAFTVEGATGNVKTAGDIEGQNIKANGALNGNSLNVTKDAAVGGKLDVTGNATVGGTLGVTGAATLGSTLDVTGKATLKDELQVDKKATFGTAAGSQTVINGGDITADGSVTAKGGLSAADGKFTVEGATGNTTVGGTLKSKGNFSVGDADQFTVDAATGNVVSKGKITSASAKIGAVEIANDGTITGVKAITTESLTVNNGFITNGNIESKGLKVNGNAEITGTLGVTGAVTGASFNGAAITATTFNGATIDATHFNNVTLSGGNVGANAITGTTITGTTVTDGAGASMNAGTVKGKEITDGAGFTATGGKVAANDINATTGTIAGVGFAANNVSGINNLTATGTIQGATLKVNDNNLLDSNGLKAEKAVIDNLTIDGASITSNNADGSVGVAGITVDKTGAITGVKAIDGVAVAGNTASGLTIGSGATAVTIGGNSLALSSTNFNVDDDGDVIAQSFTAGASHLKDGELKLNAANIWNTTEGIKAEKAVIGANTFDAAGISTTGTLGVKGQATFGDSTSGNYTTVNGGKVDITANGGTTTIEGAKITTKTLDVEDIILRNEMKDGTGATINIKGSDGSMSVASGAFAVDKEGQLTNKITGTAGGFSYETKLETSKSGIKANYTNAINGNQNIIDMGANGISIGVAGATASVGAGFKAELDAATIGYGTANSIVVNKDTIKSALGTGVTRVMTNSTTEQSIVDKVGVASRSLTAGEIVDAAGGMTITTNNTGTTFSDGTTNTLIKGSAITSTNSAATGVLDGSSLTLTNGANSTALTAGGATFTGDAGEKGGKVTTINGGTITTDTLNVERINLGGELYDKNGTAIGGNLSMDKDGNFSAAGGNFKVTGGTGADKGAFTNTVGNTTLQTDTTGASMKYNNGTVESNVSVGDNSAMVSAGASSIEVKNEGITNNGKTTFKGAVDATVPTTETTINGNTITTGHLITDRLTITGSGAAAGAGTGTIALGGDGSITSNIKDAATGKEATFKTNAEGTFTHAKDGANETTNTVNAQGNTNEVTDGTNTSTATQTATSIGGVVTNGTVTMKQELTADGVKFEQTGHDEVNIAKGDVTVKNNRNAANPGQEVHLSDLGSLNNLDGELAARDEYTDNKTAVGAINAEAGIRREEVARLDNRIDDVNNRVDKVGAMAAAIASLKSIGYDPQAPSEFSIGLGQYKGETGVAMGFFHYPNKNFMINVSLSTAGGETMGGIGATWRFGHKSPQKLLDEQREAQAKKELAAAEKYQAAAKLAKEAQERAEYAAKLARQAQVSADNAKAAADATQAKHFQ